MSEPMCASDCGCAGGQPAARCRFQPGCPRCAASERPPVDPLREAAEAMVARYSIAPYEVFDDEVDALRAALASPAAPRPEGPNPYRPDTTSWIAFEQGLLAAAPRPEGLPDEEGVRNWPGGGGRVSKDALGEPRWSLDPDGAWVVLYAPRQFLDGLRPRLSDTGDTPKEPTDG